MMIVRFGFVAMSVQVDASVSKTMTMKTFKQIPDQKAALRQLIRIARENIHNTQRILYHCVAHDIRFYRFSSRLIPLAGHERMKKVNLVKVLEADFRALGDFVRKHRMRVGFHPEHFTVLNSPRRDVIIQAVRDLRRHVEMLKAMGLDSAYKCNIHVGGTYGDKRQSTRTFLANYRRVHPEIRSYLCLENDDRSFTARETLDVARSCGVPMVLDLHHHWCNHDGETVQELWPDIVKTWDAERFPPKVHVSSPKNENEFRSHADYVTLEPLLDFLRMARSYTDELHVMIEAKKKDAALFDLMNKLTNLPGIRRLDQATIQLEC